MAFHNPSLIIYAVINSLISTLFLRYQLSGLFTIHFFRKYPSQNPHSFSIYRALHLFDTRLFRRISYCLFKKDKTCTNTTVFLFLTFRLLKLFLKAFYHIPYICKTFHFHYYRATNIYKYS